VETEEIKKERLSWDTFFMMTAELSANRSTCRRRQVGAIIVKDHRILVQGYNGAPEGSPHCIDGECERERLGIESGKNEEICWAAHAEANAIVNAARFGIGISDAIMYCTHKPCISCLKLIINSGISEVRYKQDYPSTDFYDKILLSSNLVLMKLLEDIK